MRVKVIKILKNNKWAIKWSNYFIWIAVIILLIIWLLEVNVLGFDITYEPLFLILSYASVGLTHIFKLLLEDSEYSPAEALAYGYVDNCIEPVITQLMEEGENSPKIYIYIPKNIHNLSGNFIDRVKAQIKNNDYDLYKKNLSQKHARSRDVLCIEYNNNKVYFDFPNTLLSLSSYIDYKIQSKANELQENKKRAYEKQLIERFCNKVEELLKIKNLKKYVKYIDKDLNFGFV